jgi:hypothetical protein
MRGRLSWFVVVSGALSFLVSAARAADVIVIGGGQGLKWESGGGTIQATVIRGAAAVEHTNAPGGVINFKTPGRPNWTFPQRADSTKSIALGINSSERGGSIVSPNANYLLPALPFLVDNDGSTALAVRAASSGESARALGIIIDFDLGTRFGVNRIKFFPRNADPAYPAPQFPFQKDYLRAFELFVNNGLRETQFEGFPILSTVALESQNDQAVVDVRVPPQYVRYVRLKSLTTTGFEIAEFQVFGTGFVPEAQYVSNIFDFGGPALLGKLRWVQEKTGDPQLSTVRIRTRTGIDPQPVRFNKIRPGERIFRVGGGSGTGREGTSFSSTEVPWKWAQDVSQPKLQELIETVLDNQWVDVREALERFKELAFDEQQAMFLTEEDYGKLGDEDKGAIRDDLENWSAWSPPYPLAGSVAAEQLADASLGAQIVSPGPWRYFQFMVEFSSQDFESASGVGGLAFDAVTPPFADELVAEIAPRLTRLGATTRFTYAVLAKGTAAQNRGFDRLAVDTPLRTESIGRIRIARPGGQVLETDFSSVPLTNLPVSRDGFTIVEVRDDGFVVSFPRVTETGALVKVEFGNAVLRFGTIFSGRAYNVGDGEQLGQEVVAGNAVDFRPQGLEDPDTQPVGTPNTANLSVVLPLSRDLLINVVSVPPVFSPNGDGINDQGAITYDITNVASPAPVRVDVYDLAGQPVRRIYHDADLSGRFSQYWDGRDDAGQLVPPGHYVFTVSLRAGTGEYRQVGTVGVVY